jgi:hypothetical protein
MDENIQPVAIKVKLYAIILKGLVSNLDQFPGYSLW